MRSSSPIAIIAVGLWSPAFYIAGICNFDHPLSWSFLVFLSLSTFSRALGQALGLFGQDGHTGWPHRMAVIINYQMKCAPSQITGVSHNYKKELRVVMSSLKKSFEHRFQRKWRCQKLWRKLSFVFTGHLMGLNNLFSFIDTWAKESKTGNCLQKVML